MAKNFILLFLFICIISFSCSPTKNTFFIKLNDLDSVIKKTIPSHGCNCKWNWGDKKVELYNPNFNNNMYGWASVFSSNMDTVEKVENSKKIFLDLINLNRNYDKYETFFIEYISPILGDSTKVNHVGTWFYIKNGCEGYAQGITKDSMITLTKDKEIRKKLCVL